MAPKLLFDLSAHDLDKVLHGPDHIESYNPHRGAMRLLDAIVWEDLGQGVTHAIGYKDVRDDEFWVPGHIPGRPIFPGVLMIEAAAQFASYITMRHFSDMTFSFIGFAGVDNVKFRGQVTPGDRLYLLIDGFNMKPRRAICNAQGVVNGNLVFEATITGMPM
jgi:3-hydroxyacyl-[acyl-carrier-protein] dehydratase